MAIGYNMCKQNCRAGDSMKDITLSANEKIIDAAERLAVRENTTLNEQFQSWLAWYAEPQLQIDQAMKTLDELKGKISTGGRKFTREEMNERR